MAFFNQNKGSKKVPLHKFLAKMKEFSEGKIAFDELCAWIDSKPNKDELYQYLRIGAQTVIDHIRQIDDPAEQKKFEPFLKWILGASQTNAAQPATDTANNDETPTTNSATSSEE